MIGPTQQALFDVVGLKAGRPFDVGGRGMTSMKNANHAAPVDDPLAILAL